MLTKIGNSQGIRIPKSIIKQADLEGHEIEFEVVKDGLLLKPVKVRRLDWDKNIKKVLSDNKDIEDEGLVSDLLNDSDLDRWEW